MKQETIQHTESNLERRDEDPDEVFIGPEICVSTVDVGGPYFYFRSLKELRRKLKKLPPGYEEFELSFRGKPSDEAPFFRFELELFEAMQVDLANIDDYYEALEEERGEDIIKFIAASRLSQYSNLKTVSDIHSFDGLHVYEGRLEDAQKDWWYNEIAPQLPEHLRWIEDIVDPEDAARAVDWGSNMHEMEINDTTYVVVDDC